MVEVHATQQQDANSEHSTVVLFTRAYPFGDGEPFIESEIDHLVAAFDRVVVVPVGASSSMKRRDTPDGVMVLNPSKRSPALNTLLLALCHPVQLMRHAGRAVRINARMADKLVDFKFRLRSQVRVSEVTHTLASHVAASSQVVFYAYWLHLPAAVAADVRRRNGFDAVPLVSRAHRFDIYGEGRDGFLPQRTHILSEVDDVFAVSQAGREYLRARWPGQAEKFKVARLGTPVSERNVAADQESMLVRSCSRIVPFKRLGLLIDALSTLQQRGTPIRWEHIGKVEGEYANAIQRYAEEQLADGSFAFLGGMSNSAVRKRHSDCGAAVFVNVSESEGVPVSILEALATGLPVVATDVGGNAEAIETSTGMFDGLLPPDSSAGLIADRLQKLFEATPSDYHAFTTGSFSWWERTWSSQKNFSEFSQTLKTLAQQGRRRVDGSEETDWRYLQDR